MVVSFFPKPKDNFFGGWWYDDQFFAISPALESISGFKKIVVKKFVAETVGACLGEQSIHSFSKKIESI